MKSRKFYTFILYAIKEDYSL